MKPKYIRKGKLINIHQDKHLPLALEGRKERRKKSLIREKLNRMLQLLTYYIHDEVLGSCLLDERSSM